VLAELQPKAEELLGLALMEVELRLELDQQWAYSSADPSSAKRKLVRQSSTTAHQATCSCEQSDQYPTSGT
jgi:hypothetical protein